MAVEGVWLARRPTLSSFGSWFKTADNCCVMTEQSARNSSSCNPFVKNRFQGCECRTHSFDGPQGPVGHCDADFFVAHLDVLGSKILDRKAEAIRMKKSNVPKELTFRAEGYNPKCG